MDSNGAGQSDVNAALGQAAVKLLELFSSNMPLPDREKKVVKKLVDDEDFTFQDDAQIILEALNPRNAHRLRSNKFHQKVQARQGFTGRFCTSQLKARLVALTQKVRELRLFQLIYNKPYSLTIDGSEEEVLNFQRVRTYLTFYAQPYGNIPLTPNFDKNLEAAQKKDEAEALAE